jgi:2-(1,2-epoxy-1,2-dihydrophenyl)acetyl-CoA isomerase
MDFSFIKFEIIENVAKISLNRPDVLNSFNRQMAKELQDAVDICRDDKKIRAVYLTGEGRGFCAGQDLAEAMSPDSLKIGDIVKQQYNPVIIKIRELEKPVICAVNGVAAGAGANLAISCDITFAAASASFIQSFSKIGLIPDSGGTFFLPRLVGVQRAAALMMLGEKVKAEQAVQFGMIYKVCEDLKLHEEAFSVAKQLSQMPTKGLGLTKRGLNKSFFNDLNSQLDFEAEIQAEAGKSLDFREGVKAFIEKRLPVFKGE